MWPVVTEVCNWLPMQTISDCHHMSHLLEISWNLDFRNSSSITIHPSSRVPHYTDMSAWLFTHDQSMASAMSPKLQPSVEMAGLLSDLHRVCTDIVLYKYTYLQSSWKGVSVNSLLHLTWVVLSLQPVLRWGGRSLIFISQILLLFKAQKLK